MITEAGIIGKIGLNAAGVAVCLNAIKAPGVNLDRLPVHLALRRVLQCTSKDEAVAVLKRDGLAAACHILVADAHGAIGVEGSAKSVETILPQRLMIQTKCRRSTALVHTNHYLVEHKEVCCEMYLANSPTRLSRMWQLINTSHMEGKEPTLGLIESLLEDEKDWPTSINRDRTKDSTLVTVFSIVMDLTAKEAKVKVERPTKANKIVWPNAVHEDNPVCSVLPSRQSTLI